MSLSQQLLEILVCPKCKGDLEYRDAEQTLICHTCRLRYPIRDEIPIMLIDEATPLYHRGVHRRGRDGRARGRLGARARR